MKYNMHRLTELSLSHLWLDNGLLMARDHSHGYLILCSESEFYSGYTDSLKKNWKLTESGYRYREIKRKKKCHAGAPVFLLQSIANANLNLIEKSFKKVYQPVGS